MSTAQALETGDRRPAAAAVREKAGRTQADVQIAFELCKGCWLCVHACPEQCLGMSKEINRRGYRYALYTGTGCTGCGVCFYTCPEPSTLTVIRGVRAKG